MIFQKTAAKNAYNVQEEVATEEMLDGGPSKDDV